MSKITAQVQTIRLVCDECGKQQECQSFPKDWYEFEAVQSNGFRVFETVRVLKSFEASNILKRDVLAFCSLAHARAYMYRSMDSFISEIKPPQDRAEDTRLL